MIIEKGMKNEKEIRRLPIPPTSGSGVAHMSKTYSKSIYFNIFYFFDLRRFN